MKKLKQKSFNLRLKGFWKRIYINLELNISCKIFKKENWYITRSVVENISIEVDTLLWNLMDNLTIEKDSL